jgi:hypothetical protein
MLSFIVVINYYTDNHITEAIKKNSELLAVHDKVKKIVHVTTLRIFGYYSRVFYLSEFNIGLIRVISVCHGLFLSAESKPVLAANINKIDTTISNNKEDE